MAEPSGQTLREERLTAGARSILALAGATTEEKGDNPQHDLPPRHSTFAGNCDDVV